MARHTTGKAKILTDAQQRAVLGVLASTRERAMFLLSVKAGLRAVEIAGLQWRHDRGEILELTSDITKGEKPRTVPVAKALREALDALRMAAGGKDDHAPVFPNQQMKGHPMSPNAVAQWFRYLYRERMGWDGYSSHSGRRTFITNSARKISTVGGSLRDIQDIVGHASLKTTQAYIDVNADAKRRIVDLV